MAVGGHQVGIGQSAGGGAPEQKPRAAVGFSIAYGVSDVGEQRWIEGHKRVLGLFPWLQSTEIRSNATRLRIWSHFDPFDSILRTESGQLLLLVGSPLNRCSWAAVEQLLEQARERECEFVLPWEGRCILLQVDSDGSRWDLWNDWAASIPVFHTSWDGGGICSSLEPVTVDVAGLNSSHFSKRGLVELLLLGQFLDTDTLYESMRVLPPDSHTVWQAGTLASTRRLWTVQASDAHFSTERSILVDVLHDLTSRVISDALANEEAPILLPLSSGMDSRLIAAVAAGQHLEVESYSYGPKEWAEVVLASRVAATLGIPWQRIELSNNYRADFVRRWLDWFGGSLHAHGMYQFPLLTQIEGRGGVIPNGFYGNNMAGGDHPNDCLFEANKTLLDRFCGYGRSWNEEDLAYLLDFDPTPYYSEMNELLRQQVAMVAEWPEYQQMNVLDMWNRQARFIFYQPMMYSYYGHERSPFLHRDYARFCMSLPPDSLRKRSLQIQMLDKYWPRVGMVGGTFRPLRGGERVWHSVRYHVARRLPRSFRPFMGSTWLNKTDPDCATARKWDNFYPISPGLADIGLFRRKEIMSAAHRALAGSPKDIAKMAAVQPVVACLLRDV